MSKEFAPRSEEPHMDVVSDDVVLPVEKTGVIARTRKQYTAMESHEKRDFWMAVAATAGGVALTAAAFAIETRNPNSKKPAVLRTAGYALDFVDGYFAKRSATAERPGAATELGAIADPLADKINNTLNEVSLAKSGKIHPAHLGIRALRDISITATRHHVTKHSSGEVDVKANKFGKFNTLARDGVNLFASTETAAKRPRLNKILQIGATVYSVVSGAISIAQIVKSYRKNK